LVRNASVAIRQIRNEYKVKPGKTVRVQLRPTPADAATAESLSDTIGALTRSTLHIESSATQSNGGAASAHQVLTGGTEIVIAMAELLEAESAEDTAKECARLKAELEQTSKILSGVTAKLSNDSFTSRAKPEVVEGARAQERDLTQKVESLTRKVEALCGSR
jgi:valyl-tRNA synthetase